MKGCSVHETYREGCSKCAEAQPARCSHCGYTPGAIPSDFAAYEQANCERRESHAEPAPAPHYTATQADAGNLRALFIAKLPKALRPELWTMEAHYGLIICVHPSHPPLVVSRGDDGKMQVFEFGGKPFSFTIPQMEVRRG